MAESIFVQLKNQKVTTPVDGEEFIHGLPEGLFPSDEVFADPEALVEWANNNGYTAALLQMGLQKGIIEVRACFKSTKKGENWSRALGEGNLTKMKWAMLQRPVATQSKEEQAKSLLAGLSPDQIAKILAQYK